MGRNSHYFVDKDMLAQRARNHTERMYNRYSSEISEAIKNSQCYTGLEDSKFNRHMTENASPNKCETIIQIADMGSVEAIFKYTKDSVNPGVLNFASFTNPGGMFMNGSKAQEECLCHASFLYNVLSNPALENYYGWNFKNKNRGLYKDRAIYTPNVRFFDYSEEDESGQVNTTKCSVITCAAPNWSVGIRYGKFTREENTKALINRIDLVLKVMANFNMDTIILGAFGCGVFAQDAKEVANIFKYFLCGKYKNVFKQVIFAIPSSEHDNNYLAFKNVLIDILNG